MTTESSELPVKWKKEVEDYTSKSYNVLAPKELGPIPPFHTPRLSVVEINADPDAGDVYALPGGKKYGLSKVALDRISQAAGISWLADLCGRVDDGRDPNICRYKAVGLVQDLSGQRRTIIGEKEVDLVAIEDELRESIPKRDWISKLPDRKREQAIEDAVSKEMIQFRKHKLARAQSGAMNRAIRSALALRSGYSREEIARPFVLPRVVFTPDYNDPEVKRFMLAEATGHIADLFGAEASAKTRGALPPALPPAEEELDTPVADPADPQPDPPHPGQTDVPWEDKPSEPEPKKAGSEPPLTEEARFLDAYEAEAGAGTDAVRAECVAIQVQALKDLRVRKGEDKTTLTEPLEKFARQKRKAYCEHLCNKADVKKAEHLQMF